MSDHQATPEQWAKCETDARVWSGAFHCVLELRARVEALEGKYETMRLATLEWGEDVDKVKRWSDQHLQRIMALEANPKPTPNPSQIRSSLTRRVACAIGLDSDPINWVPEARAAIREVAAHIRANVSPGPSIAAGIAAWLEQEAAQPTSQED